MRRTSSFERFCLHGLLLLLVSVWATAAWAATVEIKGIVQDADGRQPVLGARVDLFCWGDVKDPNKGVTSDTTDKKGTFTFSRQAPGHYILKVSKDRFGVKWRSVSAERSPSPDSVKIQVQALSESTTPPQVTIVTISGSIASVDRGDLLSGARVALYLQGKETEGDSLLLREVTTSSEGKFGLGRVLPGHYFLRVSKDEYVEGRKPLSGTGDPASLMGEVTLRKKTYELRVTVRCGDDVVPNAKVSLFEGDASYPIEMKTDGDGSAAHPNAVLKGGRLKVSKWGYRSKTLSLDEIPRAGNKRGDPIAIALEKSWLARYLLLWGGLLLLLVLGIGTLIAWCRGWLSRLWPDPQKEDPRLPPPTGVSSVASLPRHPTPEYWRPIYPADRLQTEASPPTTHPPGDEAEGLRQRVIDLDSSLQAERTEAKAVAEEYRRSREDAEEVARILEEEKARLADDLRKKGEELSQTRANLRAVTSERDVTKKNLLLLVSRGFPDLQEEVRLRVALQYQDSEPDDRIAATIRNLSGVVLDLLYLERSQDWSALAERVKRVVRDEKRRRAIEASLRSLERVARDADLRVNGLFGLRLPTATASSSAPVDQEDQFRTWIYGQQLPEFSTEVGQWTGHLNRRERWTDAGILNASAKDLESYLLGQVFSAFFVALMHSREALPTDLASDFLGLDKRIRSFLVTHYGVVPQDIHIGKEFSSEEFIRGQACSPQVCPGQGNNSIVDVQSWGYLQAESTLIRVKAKVVVVDESIR